MTRVFLAAGVAALAIAAPASAGPHGGPDGGRQQVVQMRGGGPQAVRGGGGRAFAPQRQAFAAPRMQRQAFAAPRMQRQQRFAIERPQRQQRFAMARPQHALQMRAERQQMRTARVHGQSRMALRQEMRASRVHGQSRMAMRQQTRANRVQAQTRLAERQQMRVNRAQQAQNRVVQRQQLQANRQQLQANRLSQPANRMAQRQQMIGNGQALMAQRQQLRAQGAASAASLLAQRRALMPDRIANANAFASSRFAALAASPQRTLVAPSEAVRFVGQPVSTVTNYVPLSALPASVSYLYPDTPNYYYQYGDGYLYQVDRSTSLIDALIPLLAGGFLPGTYLPSPYMSSYVPASYGLDSFYPAYYGGTCNRYANGVVYQVDCVTGMVEDVVPLYAGGYGVGQMLPSAYDYYNVPMQYRSLYYPTADYSYWYAPGAIYQYDPRSSLITSVAALMSPGFTVGQALPAGYDVYNVPYPYRQTYYDTPTAWYRYNNGYIYQVDPSTMLVTAMVASLLT